MMKANRFHLSLIILISILAFTFPLHNIDSNQWITLKQMNQDDLVFRFKMIKNPDFTDMEWLSIDIENRGDKNLVLAASNVKLDFQILDPVSQEVKEYSTFDSPDPYHFADNNSPLPLSDAVITPGNHRCIIPLSVFGATFFGLPKEDMTVAVNVDLQFSIAGSEPVDLFWEEKNIVFTWPKVIPGKNNELRMELIKLLNEPTENFHVNKKMEMMLRIGAVSREISFERLLKSVKMRTEAEGKSIILTFMNERFAKNSEFNNYFLKELKTGNYEAIDDLLIAKNVWNEKYLEPIISMFEKANLGQSFRIMDLLYLHQKEWIKERHIPIILSDLITYRFEDIIYESADDLSLDELTAWSSAVSMLGKTGNKRMQNIICPFLECKIRILEPEILENFLSTEAPRPSRVCDNALEAMLRLNGKNPDHQYQTNGFEPPYIHGEAGIIIDRVRNNLIKDWQLKCN